MVMIKLKGKRPLPGPERDLVHFGGKVIEYTVRRSRKRKKTIEIRLDHGVLVAAPLRTAPERIRQVVLQRAGWIVRKSAEEVLHPRRKEFVCGESLSYLGREAPVFVECTRGRRVAVGFEDWGFRIAVPTGLEGEERRSAIERAVVSWYRARAGEHLADCVERWSKVASLTPEEILVRDQRRRWGSCSTDGTIRFNWRIVMAPPELMDYLVLHELVHLRIRNHSPAFWSEMARLMPDCKARRSNLREIGPRLVI